MADERDQELVRDLAREIVQRVAPGEERIFALECEAYFADPRTALRVDSGRGGPLDIDVSQVALAILTPVALAVAAEVTRYLVVEAGRRAADVARRLLRRGEAAPVLDLAPAELIRVRQIVVEVVGRSGRPEEVARSIVAALVEQEADSAPETGSTPEEGSAPGAATDPRRRPAGADPDDPTER